MSISVLATAFAAVGLGAASLMTFLVSSEVKRTRRERASEIQKRKYSLDRQVYIPRTPLPHHSDLGIDLEKEKKAWEKIQEVAGGNPDLIVRTVHGLPLVPSILEGRSYVYIKPSDTESEYAQTQKAWEQIRAEAEKNPNRTVRLVRLNRPSSKDCFRDIDVDRYKGLHGPIDRGVNVVKSRPSSPEGSFIVAATIEAAADVLSGVGDMLTSSLDIF